MKRHARTVTALTLAAAALGVAWLYWASQAPAAPLPEHGDTSTASPPPVAAGAAAPANETLAPSTADVGTRGDATPTVGGLVPIPSDARWVDVRIVDGATGASVPNAAVAWFDPTISNEVQRRPELLPCPYGTQADHEAMATLFGWRTRSDRDGMARIHVGTSTTVVARRGDDYGQLVLLREHLPPPGGFELVLGPDATVRIRVIDAAGKPVVGVPVAWAILRADGTLHQYRNGQPEATTQAPDGIATLPHIQRWRSTYDVHRKLGNHWRASLYWPDQEASGVAVDFDAPPREPIELRLPPSGTVRARLADGLVAAAQASAIQLHWRPDASHQRGGFTLRSSPGADGWAVFPRVPLGQRWQAVASIDGGTLDGEFVGPAAEGANVDVEIRENATKTLVTGRAIDEQGRPLANCGLRFEINRFEVWSITTNADGEFRFVMRPRPLDSPAIEAQMRGQGPDKRWRLARLPPRSLSAAVEPFGDVVLAPEPLLAAGRFVVIGAEQGYPNAGAKVDRFPVEGEPETDWHSLPDTSFMRLSAERFEVRGPIQPGRYRLRTTSRNFLPIEPIEFVPGREDLVVELHPAAQIAATVQTPDIGLVQLSGRLVPVGDTPTLLDEPGRLLAMGMRVTALRQQLTWRGIAAGTYQLEVLLAGFATPVLTIENVRVPGTAEGDPRLVDIDLSRAVRVQEFVVATLDGRPPAVGGAMFALPLTRQSQGLTMLPPRGEVQRALLPDAAVDLFVIVPGYRPQTVTCRGEPVRVQLEPLPTIELRLREPIRLPEGKVLKASLHRCDLPWDWPQAAAIAAQPTLKLFEFVEGVARVEIGDGEHEVRLYTQGDGGLTPIITPSIRVSGTMPEVQIAVPAHLVR